MVQSALASHQGWVVAVRWAPNKEHQLLSGSYDSALKSVALGIFCVIYFLTVLGSGI